MAIQKAAASAVRRGMRINPLIANRIRNLIEGRPGNVFKFDALSVKQVSKSGFAFKGTGSRPHLFQGRPLGGERLSIQGVYDALRNTFTKYTETVLGKLRG